MGAKEEAGKASPLAGLALPVLRRSVEDISLPSCLGRPRGSVELAPSGMHTKRDPSMWVLDHLTEMGLKPQDGSEPLSLLEVGATETQLLDTPWLSTEAIPASPRPSGACRAPLLDLGVTSRYHVIVHHALNAHTIPATPTASGSAGLHETLRRCHGLLREGGHLFLTLPLDAPTALCPPKRRLPPRTVAQPALAHALHACGLRLLFHKPHTHDSPALVVCRRDPVCAKPSPRPATAMHHPLFAPFLLHEPIEA